VEIKDYLKVLGKRAWLLIMIPAVAGVVAGLIAVQQPQAFRTTATLQLPHAVTSSPAEVAQQVADFKAAAANPTVQNKVSKNTQLTLQQIRHLKITQVGDSSQLTLSYQTKSRDPAAAKKVILGISSGALKYLEAPEQSTAQKAVDAANDKTNQAQDTVDTANSKLNDIYNTVKSNDPVGDLRRIKDERSQFNQAYARAQAEGNTTSASIYKGFMDQADLQIIALGHAVPDVEALNAQVAEAQKSLTDAQTEREVAVAQLAALSADPDITFSAEGTPVVRKTRVVKTAAAAVVAGFPIAVGVVLLLDALQRRRQNRPPRPTREELEGQLDEDLEPSASSDVPLPVATVAAPARGPSTVSTPVVEPAAAPAEEIETVPVATAVAVAEPPADLDELDELEDEDDELDDHLELEDEDVLEEDDTLDEDTLDDEDLLEEDALEDVVALEEDALADAELDGEVLDDEDLDDEDLDDADLDDELDDDVDATVASRRRMYDADIDDDLSVDGDQAATNGQGRVWARVPAAEEDFDGDDEAGADR
jgi:flagellar biosynthesis chaperone FliJ